MDQIYFSVDEKVRDRSSKFRPDSGLKAKVN